MRDRIAETLSKRDIEVILSATGSTMLKYLWLDDVTMS
jgi:hypothetical protein